MAGDDEKRIESKKAQEEYARDETPDPLEEPQEEKEHPLEGGDAALANAPVVYKIIALTTALMLPSKDKTIYHISIPPPPNPIFPQLAHTFRRRR